MQQIKDDVNHLDPPVHYLHVGKQHRYSSNRFLFHHTVKIGNFDMGII